MKEKDVDIPEMQSDFDAIKIVDEGGTPWWNSRRLSHVLGYGKYWNFQRLMEKTAAFLQKEKGLNPSEHFRVIEETVELGSGSVRTVTSVLLSKVAAMAIVSNADQKKPMVKLAKSYFSQTLNDAELAIGLQSNMLIYKTSTGKVAVDVIFNGDTFWMSQSRIATLFGVDVSTINYHLHNIDESGEVHLSEAVRKIPMSLDKWSDDSPLMYNLDAIIAVGYRVNSYEATQFRIWATSVLKEYIKKGFVLNDDRLKGTAVLGPDYFEELLERIREIRTSERRYYQKITDIYSECSADYDPNSETSQRNLIIKTRFRYVIDRFSRHNDEFRYYFVNSDTGEKSGTMLAECKWNGPGGQPDASLLTACPAAVSHTAFPFISRGGRSKSLCGPAVQSLAAKGGDGGLLGTIGRDHRHRPEPFRPLCPPVAGVDRGGKI